MGAESRHVPLRMCAVCRERRPRRDLLRHTLIEGKPVPDLKQVAPGRGLYICGKPECAERFAKSRGPKQKARGRMND